MQADQAAKQPASSRGGRWWWIGTIALAGGLALYAGWGWLAATGLSAIVLALAPCLAMCALGLCMRRGKTKGELPLTEIRRTYDDRG